MAGNTGTPGAAVSERLLAVLACFDVSSPQLTLTEISAKSGLPLSTTRRLIESLTRWGGLERMVDNRYRVGMRLWTIGSLAPLQRDLRETALPLMHDLYEATRENVQLAVLDGTEALCIEKISAVTAVPSLTAVGGRLPLHATAVGKCLLAFSPRQLLLDVAEHGLRRHTPQTITAAGQLATALREIRRTGVAFSREEMTTGAVSVASPIVSGGVLHGAMGIVAHHTTNLAVLAPAIRTAALTVSRTCA